VFVVGYVVVIFGLKLYFSRRKEIDVRGLWFLWNTALAIFSIIGALRLFPFFLSFLWFEGTVKAFCTSPVSGFGGEGATALWTCLFIFSKIPELGDTLFVVVGKRPLLFLHWYHHITVLLFCWYSYAERASVGLSFAAMNYFVHAVMYTYYAIQNKSSMDLAAAKRIKDEKQKARASRKAEWLKGVLKAVAPVVTFLQISQMAVGIWVMSVAYPLLQTSTVHCHTTRKIWFLGSIMYLSYFILFVLFALERYICPAKPGEKQKEP